MKLLSRTYEEISAGSFVHMEEHIIATYVMSCSTSRSLLGNLKKLQYKIITKLQREENGEGRNGKRQCGSMSN